MLKLKCAMGLLVFACGAGVAQAQTCVADLPGGNTIESAQYRLAWRTQPQKIVIGRHFALEVLICPKGAGGIEGLQVDAFMPDHRHGMNYRPAAKVLGGGRYQVDGLMFHMPGRWDLYFDIKGGGGTERLTQENVLR
jgi:hypothetical protein